MNFRLTHGLELPSPIDDRGTAAGGGGYHASAVQFAIGAHLDIASLTCVDSPSVSGYIWAKCAFSSSGSFGIVLNNVDVGDGLGFADASQPTQRTQAAFIENADFANVTFAKSTTALPDDIWFMMAFSFDNTAQTAILRLNNTVLSLTYGNSGTGFTPVINGTPAICSGPGGGTAAIELSDAALWVGQNIDWSNAADALNVISAGGKPVDPSVAVAAYGTPTILFSGDVATYSTNQGSGGAFTVTGTITNAGTSPSD